MKAKKPIGLPGCGCAALPRAEIDGVTLHSVTVLEEKQVAGFTASVLETKSASALTNWLRENGYAYSPEIEAWAKPYVEGGWKITALKVTKNAEKKAAKDVTATALRMSFKTDRPLFPYREPESANSAAKLGIEHRLLRIYFLAEARYQGELTKESRWTGKVAWAGRLSAENRLKTLEQLGLPATTGPIGLVPDPIRGRLALQARAGRYLFSFGKPGTEEARADHSIREGLATRGRWRFLVGAAVVLAMWLTRVRRRWL